MIVELTAAIEARLKAAGLKLAHVEIHGLKPDKNLPSPSALIFVDSGAFEKVSSETCKMTAEVTVALMVRDLGREKNRRAGVSALVEGVMAALAFQTLDLNVSPLKPLRFENVTDSELADLGVMIFALKFSTSWAWTKPDDEVEAVDLIRIGLNYLLQDPYDDGGVDASDLIDEPYTIYSPCFSFVGVGLNDFNLYGQYSGPEIEGVITVTISTGDPDTVAVTLGGSDPVSLEITGSEQALPGVAGVLFSFDATTGHTDGDVWTISLNG